MMVELVLIVLYAATLFVGAVALFVDAGVRTMRTLRAERRSQSAAPRPPAADHFRAPV